MTTDVPINVSNDQSPLLISPEKQVSAVINATEQIELVQPSMKIVETDASKLNDIINDTE
jgi:hypothetical protein